MEVFKIQVPLMTTESEQLALIYNSSRRKMVQIPVTKEISNFMNGSFKKFAYGTFDKGEKFKITKEAPWQNW